MMIRKLSGTGLDVDDPIDGRPPSVPLPSPPHHQTLAYGRARMLRIGLGLVWAAAGASASQSTSASAPRPHIVFLFCDNVGWYNVGYHRDSHLAAELSTPNIDALAANGLELDRMYTCEPPFPCCIWSLTPSCLQALISLVPSTVPPPSSPSPRVHGALVHQTSSARRPGRHISRGGCRST